MTLPFMLVFSHLSPLTSHLLPLTSYLITSPPSHLSKLPSYEVRRAKYCTIVELIMEFEKEFGISIPDDKAEKIATVGDAISYIEENAK